MWKPLFNQILKRKLSIFHKSANANFSLNFHLLIFNKHNKYTQLSSFESIIYFFYTLHNERTSNLNICRPRGEIWKSFETRRFPLRVISIKQRERAVFWTLVGFVAAPWTIAGNKCPIVENIYVDKIKRVLEATLKFIFNGHT